MSLRRTEEIDGAIIAVFESEGWRTFEDLSAVIGADGREVEEAILRLESAGYVWDRHPALGLSLRERSSLLHDAELTPYLRTKWLGKRAHFFRRTGSTNDLLIKGPYSDLPVGTILVTEEQYAGRGRHGRSWEAPAFEALQFSILLRPRGGAEVAALTTLTAGVSVAETLEDLYHFRALVRWPNDVVFESKKVCGILSEYRTQAGSLVVGIGLNVNQKLEVIPEGGASLRTVTGEEQRRGPLLAAILGRLEYWLERSVDEGFAPLLRLAEERSELIGKRVTIDLGGTLQSGVATGIGDSGGLILNIAGQESEFCAGEVLRVERWEGV